MPVVTITDYTFPDLEIERSILEPLGCEIRHGQCRTPTDLIALVGDADHVITQFAPVNADVINAMDRAKVIVRYGIGVDNVDLDAARERQIPVCNVPDFCINEVADHTLGFILSCTRRIPQNSLHVRRGNWGLATGIETMQALCDLTVGIVGFGRIGRAVAARLSAFGCRMLASDPVVSEAVVRAAGAEPVTLDRLLAESDVITLHCPASADTARMINAKTIAKARPGVILINVGRGTLVDSAALTSALENGQISAAALDVFDPEPIPDDSPLRQMDNVILASHIASASPSAVLKLRTAAADICAASVRGEAPPNIVNGVSA